MQAVVRVRTSKWHSHKTCHNSARNDTIHTLEGALERGRQDGTNARSITENGQAVGA